MLDSVERLDGSCSAQGLIEYIVLDGRDRYGAHVSALKTDSQMDTRSFGVIHERLQTTGKRGYIGFRVKGRGEAALWRL